MNLRTVLTPIIVAVLAVPTARGDVVTARIDQSTTSPGKLVVTGDGDKQAWKIELSLPGLAKDTKIHRALLYASRTEPIDGRKNWAAADIAIQPHFLIASDVPAPLKLLAPWFDAFDATAVARDHVANPGQKTAFSIDSFPAFDPKTVSLLIEYEGKVASSPKQAAGVKARHKAGQTFITFAEVEPLVTDENATWGTVQKALAERDAKRQVRYRIYRHTEPITAANLASAEWLADVAPLSGYNIEGRSVEELITMHRKRAIDDIPFARKLARPAFGNHNVNMPEMAEVVVKRFVIDEAAKPVPVGTGLYVHNPAKAGKAYYAVATMIDGATNTVDFSPANTAGPVEETVGPGAPVFQAAGTLKVFYDYPGQRRYYVQWTALPLSNLPNQYYNWAVYVPQDPPKPTPIRVAFTGDRYMKPPFPHSTDTILVSGQDRPVWSNWWGYHEALGTLRSFKQGNVQPFTQRRLFAFLDWAVKEFSGDPTRLSGEGSMDALYYGVRNGNKFAYIMTHAPDPNPQATAAEVKADNYNQKTARPRLEAAWGTVEMGCTLPDGEKVWDHWNLTEFVAKNPKTDAAFLSMGPAMLSAPWPNQVVFMKQLWESKQPFSAQFFWGGGEPVRIPEGRVGRPETFDFATNLPMLALKNNSGDMGLDARQWTQVVHGYGSGGRIAAGRRWLADVVDEPDRFEITIHGGGQVVYAGGGTSDVSVRRTQKFKCDPGQKLKWENAPIKGGAAAQSGEVTADANGLVTIPGVKFGDPSRLKISKVK